MRYFLLSLLCFICVAKSDGQTNIYVRVDVEITKEKHPKKVYTKIDISSAFPGGDSSWVRSLEGKLNQLIRNNGRAKKGKYQASVQFIVKDSSISDIRCLNDPGFGVCQELVRSLKIISPWRPAPQDIPVREYRRSY